jgi:hypothetical protein
MAVTYSTAAKDARMSAVVSTIGTSGKLKILTAADAVLVTFTLAATAGTVTGGVLTFSDANGATAGILNATASASGVAAKAIYTTSADVTVISGLTVGTSGTDLIIDNTNIASGQSVTVNSATITHAA